MTFAVGLANSLLRYADADPDRAQAVVVAYETGLVRAAGAG